MFFRLEKPGFFTYEISGYEGDKHQEEDADSNVPAAFGREPRSGKIFVPVCNHCRCFIELLLFSLDKLPRLILA